MNPDRLAAIVERKALLATRADLDRTRLALAIHEVKEIVRPTPDAARSAAARPTAAMILGLAAPLLGMRRLAHWVRAASLALTVYRVARSWRSSG
jgi:hypothetical protein